MPRVYFKRSSSEMNFTRDVLPAVVILILVWQLRHKDPDYSKWPAEGTTKCDSKTGSDGIVTTTCYVFTAQGGGKQGIPGIQGVQGMPGPQGPRGIAGHEKDFWSFYDCYEGNGGVPDKTMACFRSEPHINSP